LIRHIYSRMEIVLSLAEFIGLLLGAIALILLLIVFAIEYKHWRTRRDARKIIVPIRRYRDTGYDELRRH